MQSGGGEGRGGEQDKLWSFVILIGSNALWRAGAYPDSALDGVQAQPVGCTAWAAGNLGLRCPGGALRRTGSGPGWEAHEWSEAGWLPWHLRNSRQQCAATEADKL